VSFRKHVPLIDRDMRFDIRERMDAAGKVLIPLDEDQVRAVAAEAGQRDVKAVAILFLHSYRNAEREQRDKRIVEEAYPDLFGHRLA
jgi:N-methylhydantoinase A